MPKHMQLMLQQIRRFAELLQYVALIDWKSDTAAVYSQLQLAMLPIL